MKTSLDVAKYRPNTISNRISDILNALRNTNPLRAYLMPVRFFKCPYGLMFFKGRTTISKGRTDISKGRTAILKNSTVISKGRSVTAISKSRTAISKPYEYLSNDVNFSGIS